MQSRLSSLSETLLNTASGFLVSLFASTLIFPAFGVVMSGGQRIGTVTAFTVVSVIRGYLWRRYFNRRITKKVSQ